jgi:hypothetical protein
MAALVPPMSMEPGTRRQSLIPPHLGFAFDNRYNSLTYLRSPINSKSFNNVSPRNPFLDQTNSMFSIGFGCRGDITLASMIVIVGRSKMVGAQPAQCHWVYAGWACVNYDGRPGRRHSGNLRPEEVWIRQIWCQNGWNLPSSLSRTYRR